MTYQNRQFSFMPISTAAMKRGSMKIDPPDSERTRSHAVRSTSPIELKTRFVYGIRQRYPGKAQRKRAASLWVFNQRRWKFNRKGPRDSAFGISEWLPTNFLDRSGILAQRSLHALYAYRPPERESLFASSRTVAASNKTDSESGWLVSR